MSVNHPLRFQTTSFELTHKATRLSLGKECPGVTNFMDNVFVNQQGKGDVKGLPKCASIHSR